MTAPTVASPTGRDWTIYATTPTGLPRLRPDCHKVSRMDAAGHLGPKLEKNTTEPTPPHPPPHSIPHSLHPTPLSLQGVYCVVLRRLSMCCLPDTMRTSLQTSWHTALALSVQVIEHGLQPQVESPASQQLQAVQHCHPTDKYAILARELGACARRALY